MPKEVLVYGNIHSFSVIDTLKAMNEVDPDDGMLLRINTDGGQPQDGFGLAAKLQEFTGAKEVQVDGRAYSTGLFLLCYAEKVQAIDVAQFMVHRAGYSEWYEKSEFFTPEAKENLVAINKSLEKAFRNKIDVKKFEELKGVKIKELFDIEKPRKDVFFTAVEAKKIGLIDKVIKITPSAMLEINASMESIAAKYEGGQIHKKIDEPVSADSGNTKSEKTQILNSKKMTKEELLSAHPAICAELIADGAKKEKARVGAWMVNIDVDAAAVKAGIEAGEPLSQKDMAEFAQKQMNAIAKKGLEDDSTGTVETDKATVDAAAAAAAKGEPTAMESLEASIDAHLKINESK